MNPRLRPTRWDDQLPSLPIRPENRLTEFHTTMTLGFAALHIAIDKWALSLGVNPPPASPRPDEKPRWKDNRFRF